VHTVILAGFVAFLAIPLLLTLAGRRPGAPDNRAPSPAPELGGRALLDTGTYQQLDRYLQDRFAFRGLAIRVSAKINDELWKGDTDQVKRGKGDWLFYGPSLNQLCTEKMTPGQAVTTLAGFADKLSAQGKTVRYVLAPEKTSVYDEFLTKRTETDSQCERDARDAILRGLDRRPWFLDIYGAVRALKATASEPIYHPRDTHWNGAGAEVMLRSLVNSLQPGLWDDSEYVATGQESFTPDLTRLLGLPQDAHTTAYAVRRPGVATVEGPATAVHGDPSAVRRFTSTSTAGAPLVPGHTVMFYDSFTIGSIPNLAPYFQDITFIHWNALGVWDQVPAELRSASNVLMEGAEREFTWRMRQNVAEPGLVAELGP
jgi:hypothetical protein